MSMEGVPTVYELQRLPRVRIGYGAFCPYGEICIPANEAVS